MREPGTPKSRTTFRADKLPGRSKNFPPIFSDVFRILPSTVQLFTDQRKTTVCTAGPFPPKSTKPPYMLSKRQARTFFLGGTVVTFLIFLGLSWHSMTVEVPKRTHEENLTPQVVAGKTLWEANNCMGCHSIMGEGAYYAPELTKVVERRGPEYMKVVLTSKTPWSPRGRKMVAYGFSEQEANDLIAFFTWIGNTDLNGFPPKPEYKVSANSK